MFMLTIKTLLAHKARLLSTAFAVVLGVAFVAGTLVFTDTLTGTFDDVLTEANKGVDAMVRAPEEVALSYGEPGNTIDASVLDVVRQVDGVDEISATVTGYAQLVGPDGRAVGNQEQAPAFGFNWVDAEALNPYRLVAGRAPDGDDQIVIDKGSADASGYVPGDVVTVLTKAEPHSFTIVGVATFGTADSPAGASAILFDEDAAEQILSVPGQINGIIATASEGTSQTDLVAAIDAATPAGLETITGDQLIAEDQAAFDQAFGSFKTFMLIFAGIAVFVGAFIINNTFSITVAQRSKEMAMLRALGASRRQVLGSVLTEAIAVGLVASAAGLAAGIGVARGLTAMLESFGVELPSGSTVIRPASMLVAFGIGLVVTAVSAVLPARRAGRILPIAALRDVALDRSGTSRRRAAAGTVVTATGAGLLLIGLAGAGIAAVGGGALISLVGVAVLGPVFARPAAMALGIPLRLAGVPGEMATQNAIRSPKRTARTASALMIGVALVAFITVFGASVKSSFAGSLEDNYYGSHLVDSGVFDSRGGISPQLATTLRATPGIDAVSELRISPAVVDGVELDFFDAYTAGEIGELFDLGTIDGDLTGLGPDGIAVERGYAAEQGLTLGSTLPVTLPSGEVDFTVRAIYQGSEWFRDTFVDTAAFDAHLPGSLDSRIFVSGDDAAVNAVAAPYPTAEVLDREAFFASASGDIDQFLGIVYAMLALAVVMALFGIANTLALSIYERTREIGLLRAIGMTRRQVRATIRGESVIIALFGAMGGLGVGTLFGWATIHALADEGINTLTVPVARLAAIASLAALAGVLTAVLPARRAAELHVLDALAQ